MYLLRYYIIGSLTFNGEILPVSNDLQQLKKIYLLLLLQLLIYYIGSVLLFYFIIENWLWSALVAVLFTFIYLSISMVLFSGLRLSTYIKKGIKKNENKTIIIGESTLEVNEVLYDESKNEMFSAVILRAFFIIIFGFFIFIGLVLGISLYTKPNLDEEHSSEILEIFKNKKKKETAQKIGLLTKKLERSNGQRTLLEKKYEAALISLQLAKDETHRMIFSNDTAYFNKAILDWDYIHHHELNFIPQIIRNLQLYDDNEYKKLAFVTEHKKFGIYRINEFRNSNTFLFWLLFLVVAILFVLPYYIRFKMVLTRCPLDLALEGKIVAKIKKDYRLNHEELHVFYKKYGVSGIENDFIYDEAPFVRRKNDVGEIVALKNQMNTFLNNEL